MTHHQAQPSTVKHHQAPALLALILLAYLALGSAYALNTPLWQAPDEPAHFNYIRDLAQGRGFPVLQMGDYDQGYMEQIVAARFPQDMAIDRIRYESHQPPLYYLLQAPIFLSLEGRSLPEQVYTLRLFSLLLGALLLATIYRAARLIVPGEPVLALGVTGLVAFIPQHLHISGSINNDILGELLLSVVLLLLLVRMGRSGRVQGSGSRVRANGVQGPGSRVQATTDRVQGPGSRVQATTDRVQGPGSGVQATTPSPGFRSA
ncbi:MAG TPA: hypothetical protein VJO15_02740, partial [Dehalococcoidia bacterium]|nr:hypothetical protein [Dehalococcoidia bacterium]